MQASYIRSMIQPEKSNGSFYDQLLKVSINMTSRQFIIQDENGFDIFHLTPRAKYEKNKGIFKIYWEKELEQYINMIPAKNFTLLSLQMFMRLQSVYTYRLYEYLKSKMYIPKYADHNLVAVKGFYKSIINLSELKLILGAVDASETDVQKFLITKSSASSPDYERAVEAAKSKNFAKWQKFKTQALEIAINEINEKTDIYVEYETIKGGRGGKVNDIIFYIKKKVAPEPTKIEQLSEQKKDEILDQMLNLIEEKVSIRDCKAIAAAAEYDFSVIEKHYRMAKKSGTKIENLVGYMIAAIKNKYEPPVQAKENQSSSKKKNNFKNFNQRGTNMDPEQKKRYFDLQSQIIMEETIKRIILTEEERIEYSILKEMYNQY